MNTKIGFLMTAAIVVGATGGGATAAPLGSAFTYQGQLKEGGQPANGEYDMKFWLHYGVSGGAPLAGPLVFDGNAGSSDPVAVSNGLFSVELDFGNVFNGNALWLQIEVQPHGGSSYTPLSPRQPLSASPFALYAASAPGGSGYWSASGADIFNNNGGGVGVGTSAPADKLHVRGDNATLRLEDDDDPQSYTSLEDNSPAQMALKKYNSAGDVVFDLNPLPLDGTGAAHIRFFRATNTTGSKHVAFHRGNSSTETSAVIGVDGADSYFQLQGGKVGIGTAAPEHLLHLRGSDAKLLMAAVGNQFGPELQFRNGFTSDGVYGTIEFQDNTQAVLSSISYSQPQFTPRALVFTTAGGGVMKLTDSGNLGINTPAPNAKLYVTADTTNSSNNTAAFEAPNIGPNASHIHFGTKGDWYIRSAASNGKVVIQDSGGNVGIGTNNPSAKLDVNGTARVKVLQIMGADVAERFPVSDHKDGVEPGTVMEIDREHPGMLRVARNAYSPCVAGVVSGAGDLPAGAVLGNLPGHEAAPPIALSGRVWVRCNAGSGAIEPGDLLTSSNVPGLAMKAAQRELSYGATIGKAMTGLTSGQGLVLVLVNLN